MCASSRPLQPPGHGVVYVHTPHVVGSGLLGPCWLLSLAPASLSMPVCYVILGMHGSPPVNSLPGLNGWCGRKGGSVHTAHAPVSVAAACACVL
jgi:hypothetical protein